MTTPDGRGRLDADTLGARAREQGLKAFEAGRIDIARRAFADAVRFGPDEPFHRLALGTAEALLGETGPAISTLLDVLARRPDKATETQAALTLFALTMRWRLPAEAYSPEQIATVAACLGREDFDPQPLGLVALEIVRARTPLTRAYDILRREGPAAAAAWAVSSKGRKAATDRLFLEFLSRAVNVDAETETFLIALRAALAALPHVELKDRHARELGVALIGQCLANEYAWPVSEAERRALAKPPADPDARALLVMLYPPDGLLRDADGLQRLAKGANEPLKGLMLARVREIREEKRHAAELESLAPLTDAGSALVARHYEENPYPRWRGQIVAEPGVAAFGLRARPPTARKILIAGTGTGRQALAVAAFAGPQSEVVGLDLSRASLAYARRMARRSALERVRFVQGDLLDVERLGMRFDRIEAVGVLHHMKDPLEGWRRLAACLAPGGVIKIGLYSRAARPAIEAARGLIAARGLAPTPEGIREARRLVLAAPQDDPVRGVLAFADFYSLSEARDLMFHPIEHRFDIPAIRAAIQTLGLVFEGFEVPEEVARRFRAAHPAAEAERDLALWTEWEAAHPGTFAGMYIFQARRA